MCTPHNPLLSLEKTLFNVATSRSVFNTVIVCDENMLDTVDMDIDVRNYLERVKSNSVPEIKKPEEGDQKPGLKIIGKIDPSLLERNKKEISIRISQRE